MQVDIQMIITHDDQKTAHTVLCLEREDLSIETLGLTLKDSKAMTAEIQEKMIEAQVKDYMSQHRTCSQCGQLRLIKSYHTITCRTLFGKIHLRCPRLFECPCENKQALSISPLSKALVSRSTPDLIYMESRWASLMSYGVTAAMLEDVFPIKVSSSSVYNTAMKVATRLEQELPAERHMYIEGGSEDVERITKARSSVNSRDRWWLCSCERREQSKSRLV